MAFTAARAHRISWAVVGLLAPLLGAGAAQDALVLVGAVCIGAAITPGQLHLRLLLRLLRLDGRHVDVLARHEELRVRPR